MVKENKFILISMNDNRSEKIANVLGSKTAKKIIDVLAENSELSEKDISDKLNLPINTVEYNLKKLLDCEMIEKSSNFFWSRKGRKIVMYRLSGKSIIISPKSSRISSKIKSLLPAFIVSGVGAFLIKIFSKKEEIANDASGQILFAAKDSGEASAISASEPFISLYQTEPWLWFLAGSLLVILIFAIINWRKL